MKNIFSEDIDLSDLISEADRRYKFQPSLTRKLDSHEGDFTEMTLLDIVL